MIIAPRALCGVPPVGLMTVHAANDKVPLDSLIAFVFSGWRCDAGSHTGRHATRPARSAIRHALPVYLIRRNRRTTLSNPDRAGI